VHGLDASDQPGSASKGLESQHRPDSPLDAAVVLLDKIVQVLGLA
jgi:hypothetical protein